VEALINDPFAPSLKTHKLKGELKEFWSCSVTRDIRLRFRLEENTIELVDIGTHDEVY
jgi:addiction module RelE/StbE family toxin